MAVFPPSPHRIGHRTEHRQPESQNLSPVTLQTVRQLLVAVLAAVADEDMRAEAEPFARGLARHCAMLVVVGVAAVPGGAPPPASSQNASAAHAHALSLKELDPRLFVDAIIEVSCADLRCDNL